MACAPTSFVMLKQLLYTWLEIWNNSLYVTLTAQFEVILCSGVEELHENTKLTCLSKCHFILN